MTDKAKILAEIERHIEMHRRNNHWNAEHEFIDVLNFINSLPEEPVSNPTPNEKMSKERFTEACKAACSDSNYRSHYGHTETRDDYFVDGVQWADEHPKEEPVSEDLIQASEEYVSPWQVYAEDTDGELLLTNEPCERAFIAGAQWQKKRMMAKAIDGLVICDEELTGGYKDIVFSFPNELEVDDKVKLIIIKKD